MFSEQPDAKRRNELKDDGGRYVLHAVHHLQRQPPKSGTDDQAAGDGEEEGRRNIADCESVRGNGSYGKAVDEERARVIQKALTFEDGKEAVWRPQRAEHGGCRNGVRWRNHGAQGNGWCPRHGWNQGAGNERNRDGGESDREDHQAADWRPVVFEIS